MWGKRSAYTVDVTSGDGPDANVANFTTLQNANVNVGATLAGGINVNVSGDSSGDIFNLTAIRILGLEAPR